MKKYLFLLAVSTILFTACGKNSTRSEENKVVSQKDTISAKRITQDVEEFFQLYNELLGFKDSYEFGRTGFGQSPYYEWLSWAKAYVKRANPAHLKKYGLEPKDIIELGRQYEKNSGAENETTRILRESIDKAIVKFNGIATQSDHEDNSIPQDVQQFIELYNELHSFKSKSDFQRLGFGQGSPYYSWLNRASALEKTAKLSHFAKYGIVPGDLVALGNLYVSSKGKDTDATKGLKSAIDNGIAKATGKKNVSKVSKPISLNGNESVIGHWNVSGPMNYNIKIIKQGNQYISLENNKTIKLNKKGDKYYLENSKTGEYYKIVNGKIRFYDKDGDFTDLFKFKVETIQ